MRLCLNETTETLSTSAVYTLIYTYWDCDHSFDAAITPPTTTTNTNATMHRLPRAFRLRQQQLTPSYRHVPCQRNFSQIKPLRRPQTLYRPTGEPVRYQAVRFKKPAFFTRRRLATTLLYGVGIYAYSNVILKYLDVEIEILDDDEAEHGQPKKDADGKEVVEEEEEGEGEEGPFYADDNSTFIPLTWGTKLPRTFYRGSDTEWQDFVKVAKDKSRHKKIQNELVQIVFTGCTQHPAIARQLGKEPKVGKYWLDISFPDGPPQEYERSGVEIGDGFIAWSQQKVTGEQQWRLTRALWPRAAFDSLWATSKVLVGIQYRRVKQALGWEGKDPFSPEERFRHAMEMVQKQHAARERKEVGKGQTPDGLPTGGEVVSSGTSTTSESAPAKASAAGAGDGQKLPWQISIPLPPTSATSSTDIPIAIHVFSSTLSKQWNPKKAEPPRGSFVVQGLVEVRGQRGRMLFDVQSCYDPKGGKFVQVNAAVRNFKRWNQAPKGGP